MQQGSSGAPAGHLPEDPAVQGRRWVLTGRVQGVGFRPFVYRLASRYGLRGWVVNQLGQVEILAQGTKAQLTAFGRDLVSQAPPLARPRVLFTEALPLPAGSLAAGGFQIRASEAEGEVRVHVPPDYFTCPECYAELHNPDDRRYRYPFLNCTQCGPRYTLIARLPYDRCHTSMAGFALCPACRAEYHDPGNRRFHAEPMACPSCGPQLFFQTANHPPITDTAAALAACIQALRQGAIVAVKGVGGYHLMCAASSTEAIARLRARKQRPHKPLAVLFPEAGEDGLREVRKAVDLGEDEAALLQSPIRPILLARGQGAGPLSAALAPGLKELGVMLPYSPLHHLILNDFGAALVATSGNVSGEPVLTEMQEATARLAGVADGFLHHDRPILRPADDPVYRHIAGRNRPLRLGRGNAPLELDLPCSLPQPLLAVGGHLKTTLALGFGERVVVSPHLGDMGTLRSLLVFEQLVKDLQMLYGIEARAVVCDAHPAYATSRWAEACGLPVIPIFHHLAHASALAGEYPGPQPWLVFTWDGLGLGSDGTLWGGEAFLGQPGRWRRVASLRPFYLLGGEWVAREPWRSAAALCWEAGFPWQYPAASSVLQEAWKRRIHTSQTTAVGRLFDAAAALTGLLFQASYEGQGPMYLEAACTLAQAWAAPGVPLPLHQGADGLWRTDWAPLIPLLLDTGRPVAERAAAFHKSLALALLEQARRARREYQVLRVGLAGGVFQNRILTELATALLREQGFSVAFPGALPANDGGLSFGQIIEAAALAT
jgi:hydrogenase maturation protein HypF